MPNPNSNYSYNDNSNSDSNAVVIAVHQDDRRMIDWAQRVNQQWQVDHPLAAKADRWMRQLLQSRNDRQRLFQGTRRAFRLMMEAGRGADLKRPFYRGLLGQATDEELREFELQLPSN
ncbi:hypothetical protein FEM03_16605 [Phragmitibacter flavus]|uniref:Uncharacterized protein n=1 Tax=Phragmitibacter flavus TaxID=2576071 RepID=A0A5R8KB84_9BACT|nr:hypothetical protein [Phragmitibacter flavus]TLD69578.1 hypothetical protein FEM03_16605 [Phragmitibacter flavus]